MHIIKERTKFGQEVSLL